MQPIVKLVLATAALGLEDGGSASLSRLVAQATQSYCQENGLAFEILNLGSPTDILPDIPITHFSSNQTSMALAIWHRVFLPPQTAFIFMHIGLARPLALLPRFALPLYIVWLLGIEVWMPFNWQQRKAMDNAVLRLAISAHTRTRAQRIHPWLPQTQVLHLVNEERSMGDDIDFDLLNQLSEQSILIVGRLSFPERYKGHDELLHVMPRVLHHCPHAQLVITGSGDDLARLQTLAQQLGINQNVVFTGFVNDETLQALYKQCRVFAMPSRNEGFGLVYLEAMKEGKPCLALSDSAAAEIIVDGETGLLLKAGDLEELEQALVELLQDDDLAMRLGEAGRERARQFFSVNAFNIRVYESLTDLLEKN